MVSRRKMRSTAIWDDSDENTYPHSGQKSRQPSSIVCSDSCQSDTESEGGGGDVILAKYGRRNKFGHVKQKYASKIGTKCKKDFDISDVKLEHDLRQLLKSKSSSKLEKQNEANIEKLQREIAELQKLNEFLTKARSRNLLQLKEMDLKYRNSLMRYKRLHLSDTNKLTALEAELRLQKREAERNAMLLDEVEQKNKCLSLEKEKLAVKLEVAILANTKLKVEKEKIINAFKLRLHDKTSKLNEYQELEAGLNKAIIHAAGIACPSNSEVDMDEILRHYGFGPVVPTNSKIRLKQSLELATRVMELEKINEEMKETLFEERNDKERIRRELDVAKSTMQMAQHPTRDLLDAIYKRGLEIQRAKDLISTLEMEIAALTCTEKKAPTKMLKKERSSEKPSRVKQKAT